MKAHRKVDRITEDLMAKLGKDVSAAMTRTLALADEQLPVAMAGGAAGIGVVAGVLEQIDCRPTGNVPDPDCVFLAALICARVATRHADPIAQAYADMEALRNA